MARSRWELEENRKKKALQAVQNAIKSGASYKGNAVAKTVQKATSSNTTKKTTAAAPKVNTVTKAASKPQGAQIPSFLQGSGTRKSTVTSVGTSRSTSGLGTLRSLPVLGQTEMPEGARIPSFLRGSIQSAKPSDIWRQDVTKLQPVRLTSGAADQRAQDIQQMERNSLAWHATTDREERDTLKTQNDVLRARLGLAYDNGETYDPQTGISFSKPAQTLFSSPTDRNVRGFDAHGLMRALYERADETWNEQDQRIKETAVSELENEMQNVLSQYGLNWKKNGIGASDSWGMPDSVSDRTAVERLRAAGADQDTIDTIEENIQMREEANRLGQGATAVIKRAVGSIPALIETAQQQSENVEQSRQNPEYVQLEQQEQQLEAQLQSMPSQDADGKVPAEYMAVYNQLQEVRKRKNELAVTTPVNQNAWGQTMLREASEAQKNATAGMSDGARFLTNTGISIAGNAPTMALSAVPGVGTALGAALMGASAAGQRAAELNAQGVSPGEAFGRGIVSGLIEGVTEKMPLDTMAELLQRGGTTAVKNLLRQMGTEAGEESASYLMNYVADVAAADPNAKFSFEEMAQSALGGAVSGLAFGAAGTLLGRRRAITEQLEQQGLRGAELTDTVDAIETVADTIGADTDQSLIKANTLVRKIKQAGDVIEANGKVVELTGQEFPKGDVSLTDQVTQFFNSIGGKVTRPGFGDVALTRRGVKDSVSHGIGRKKAISFAAVPDIIRDGVQIDFQDNWKGRNYQTYIFAGRVAIDGTPHDMGVIVRSNDAHNRFYVHEVVQIEKGDTSTFKTGTNQTASVPGDDVSPLSDISISQTAANINQQEANSQALGRRMAELDAQRRQAEGLLPGPIRDRAIAEAEQTLQQVQQQARTSFATQPQSTQPMQSAAQQVPAAAAMQYGKTPAQAMMEAQERARNEAAQEQRLAEQADREAARIDAFNRITNDKPQEVVNTVREAMNLAERVAARHRLQRATVRATPSSADMYIDATAENATVELVNNLEGERFFLRNLRNAWHLTDAELVNAREIAAGRGPVSPMTEHREELVETYARALRNYQNDMEPAYEYYKSLNQARTARANELIADSDNWKDAKFGISLKVRTPERVVRKVMGDTEAAKKLYDAYFAPVIQHDAESVRWENQMRQQLKDIAKGLSHEDSVYIHLKNRAELEPHNETLQVLLGKYVEKNQKKIHFNEANDAMEAMIELTNSMHPQINEAWVRNGVEPLEWHKRYLPSITPTKEGKWYNRILRKIGIETMMDELPDVIAGRTENRRPGHQYASFANERTGVNLEFDAVKAIDNYISNAAVAIFHTDDIQNLRVLEEAIRFKYSDEGSQAEMMAIKQNPQLTIEERVQQMSDLWLKNAGTFPHFPSWIAEYTNLLAGKKARGDRQMESDLNRGVFRAMSDLEGKIAANMVGGNISTALSNIIPLAQGAGELHYSSMARATLDYGYDLLRKDSEFRETSDFLTNRRGSERVTKTATQKASDAASVPTRAIDNMTSEVLTRARYLDNTKRGMTQQEAMKEADRWVAGLMGDRSKGARPVLFEERNPISKAFSMFQLEVMNQYDYLFGDIPSNARAQGKGKLAVVATTASALLQIFLLSHLYNDAREKATGTRGAFDPIEIANDFVGRLSGYALPNVFTLIGEAAQGDLTAEDFMVQQSDSAWENAQATLQDVASNLPFLSGPIGGLFGASNARLPIESVVPNFSSIFSKTGVAQREAVIKELTKPVYGILLPFGGTQLKKTVEGIATELAGGSYVHDNDGNLKLQFPAYGQSPLEWARSAIFGKWSGEEAQKYIDSGFKGLSVDETRIYNGLRDEFGVEPSKAMDAVLSLRGFKSLENDEGKTIQTVKEQQRRALFDNAELTPEQKQWIDEKLLVDPDSDQTPADYTDYTSFVLSMYDSDDRRADAEEAVQHGLTVDQFVQWDDRLREVQGMKDRFDKNQYNDAEARGIVLDEVMQDNTLSDSEKQAIADYVLISSMDSDTQKELWKTVAKGKVNASDFLRFKSDISAYEEDAKGTGTNNMENVATILRGYDELTDEQRDILFQTYNETMSNNPFHVSAYERAIMDNSLYQSLTDEGKAALRALTNEYEQHINEGRELSEWRAKAYMAEKEAGIAPGIYALYRTVLQSVDAQNDDNNYLSQDEAEIAINAIPGLTQYQKAYIWQSMSPKWKKNPFGSATVTEYQSGVQKAINPVPTGWAGGDQSGFGPREAPIAGASTWHKALDIPANGGDPVVSIMDGKVTFSGWVDGYGWTVHIDHGNGLETEYHHMQEQSSLKPGDTVAQGDQVGAVGSTGRSQGNHLDFQVWKDGQYVDPLTVIPGYGKGPSGYIYEGSSVSSAISSGVAAAQSGSSGSSGSSGLKNLKTIKQGLGGLDSLF